MKMQKVLDSKQEDVLSYACKLGIFAPLEKVHYMANLFKNLENWLVIIVMKNPSLFVAILAIALASIVGMAVFPNNVQAATQLTAMSTSALPGCKQIPANEDSSTFDDSIYSDAELQEYGLPRRGQLPLSKWKMAVEAAKHHVCTNNPSAFQTPPAYFLDVNGFHNPSLTWSGNYSNGDTYTEADSVFYIPFVHSYPAREVNAQWVGLGGVNNQYLTQAGIAWITYPDGSVSYLPWVENIAATSGNPCGASYNQAAPCFLSSNLYPVSPHDQIQVIVRGNYMYIADGTPGHVWSFGAAYGPQPNESTAEWIVERAQTSLIGGLYYDLTNFGVATFYGMGATGVNGGYSGPLWQPHDYKTMVNAVWPTYNLIDLGWLLNNNTFGPPNDSNTLVWKASY